MINDQRPYNRQDNYQHDPMKACCQKCRFFHLPNGWCRRYPPRIVNLPSGAIASHYPMVFPDGWCGEYQPHAHTSPSGFRKFD